MCLFNFKNKSSIKAKIKGIEEFECGHCPECLQKKSRMWALRTSMEARVSPAVMVTLTYDTYKVVNGKETSEENPINPNMELSKSDCQKFLKRLRAHFAPQKIKYLLTAERGKKGRAHYHALIFGVQFPDLIQYKKSDRGNIIYKSKTLTDLWKHGICTVDCINVNAKTARYCTKYCSKDSGAEETFMLFSRGIGDEMLLKKFNGKSYWVDGREYSIPKQIWQQIICKRYNIKGFSKYKNLMHVEHAQRLYCHAIDKFKKGRIDEIQLQKRLDIIQERLEESAVGYQRCKEKREIYERIRDNDRQYKQYLEYWHKKAEVYKLTQPSIVQRILALPNNKYRSYKNKALLAKQNQVLRRDFIPPRTNSQAFLKIKEDRKYYEKAFAPLSRHYRANDNSETLKQQLQAFKMLCHRVCEIRNEIKMDFSPFFAKI